MKTKVIAVNGYSRAGKGSFVNFVRKKVVKIYEHSTIDKVKNVLEEGLMIYPGRKTEKEREFLMSVKQAWIKYNNGPSMRQ
jgi:chloramphenicol 3-O-phosphotransferase